MLPFSRYTYYFVSLHTKNIWWKSYLTGCQMVQFTIMMVQACMLFKGCGTMPPPRVVHMYFYYIGSLLFLFANFFIEVPPPSHPHTPRAFDRLLAQRTPFMLPGLSESRFLTPLCPHPLTPFCPPSAPHPSRTSLATRARERRGPRRTKERRGQGQRQGSPEVERPLFPSLAPLAG